METNIPITRDQESEEAHSYVKKEPSAPDRSLFVHIWVWSFL